MDDKSTLTKQQKIKDEIAKLRQDIQSGAGDIVDKPQESAPVVDNLPVKKEKTAQELHDEIMGDFSGEPKKAEEAISEPSAQEAPETKKEHFPGVNNVYQQDISHALRSDNPSTVSELIDRSNFEKQKLKIISAHSTKNVMYIVGSLVLIAITIFALSKVFTKKEEVIFKTETDISSLIYSDTDTGVRLIGEDTPKKRQTIRDASETKIDEGSLNNIYYVKGNERLGFQDLSSDIDLRTPDSVLGSFKNNFMHGVYKTDKNYPFMILKTDSYSGSFKAMREWESSLIEDNATLLNLPDNALDRSLVQPGFSNDIIKNKNVRVARYIPRGRDKEGRLLDIFNIGKTQDKFLDSQVGSLEENSNLVLDGTQDQELPEQDELPIIQAIRSIFAPKALAQAGSDIGATEFNITKGNVLTTNEELNFLNRERVCFNRVTGDRVRNEDYSSEALLMSLNLCFESYSCRKHACFDKSSGQEVPVVESGELKAGIECANTRERGYHCFETSTKKEVSIMDARNSLVGLSCGPTDEVVDYSYSGPKFCSETTWLTQAENIKDKQLCFDNNDKLITSGVYNGAVGGFCINPQERPATMCLNLSGEIVLPDEPIDPSIYDICFDPTGDAFSTSTAQNADLNKQFFEINDDIRSQAAALHFRMSLVIASTHLFGINDNNFVDGLKEASNYLLFVAQGRILEIEAVKKFAVIVRDLENMIEILDPQRIVSSHVSDDQFSLYREIRTIIDFIKSILGQGYSISWITLGNEINNGSLNFTETIYAGGGGPQVTAAQQTLVLIGAMDPISVSGEIDLVTQKALEDFQIANGLTPTGVLNQETANILTNIINGQGEVFDDLDSAIVNDYLSDKDSLAYGSYNEDVQSLQILLYSEGYGISKINGLFDSETCEALKAFQEKHGLETADVNNCVLSIESVDLINDLLREGNYLGSGFDVHENGYLLGKGVFKGTFGPGVADFSLNEAEASSVREGDIVLLYTFLDQETLLIATHPSVITEVIRRRSLDNIFAL